MGVRFPEDPENPQQLGLVRPRGWGSLVALDPVFEAKNEPPRPKTAWRAGTFPFRNSRLAWSDPVLAKQAVGLVRAQERSAPMLGAPKKRAPEGARLREGPGFRPSELLATA